MAEKSLKENKETDQAFQRQGQNILLSKIGSTRRAGVWSFPLNSEDSTHVSFALKGQFDSPSSRRFTESET